MNFRYPIFLDLSGKKCLVIGEGREIASKIQALREAGARVEWKQHGFHSEDLTGCSLVITNLRDNSEIFRLCEERNILCNSVDDPDCCRFILGAVHKQGDLTIAISTNGIAPALSVRLREQIQCEVGPEYGVFLDLLREARAEIAERIPDFDARRELWYRIVDSRTLELLRAGQREAAREIIRTLLEDGSSINPLLWKAIQEKRLVRLRYKDRERIVEPHDYGVHNGIIKLFGYQVAGSSSHKLPSWRWMEQDLISDVELLNRTFAGGRASASGKHHTWEKLFIRVEPADEQQK